MNLRVFLVTASAAMLLFVACGDDDDDMNMGDDTSGGAMPSETSMPMAMPSATMGGDASGSPMSGDMDMDLAFIDGMIVHHQSAIDMAGIALEEAEHPELEQLANDIIAAQQSEIEQMSAWRDEWFPGAEPSMGMPGMEDMAGMEMSAEDMQMLREADPFDEMFMEMMIEHHQSAITIAQEIQTTTERPELQELAGEIITSQQAEIDQMNAWLAEWYGQ
ncbi:MAG: DUF305 domain-containing protein [Chloroflexota bacterium]|nr:DUF305 domain-containing protein [Chloroflexota bacterium]